MNGGRNCEGWKRRRLKSKIEVEEYKLGEDTVKKREMRKRESKKIA